MDKTPGTKECFPVINEMLAEGRNINITPLFSIDAYRAVANAYIEALEKRLANGEDIHNVASVASFFVSRVDTLVDKRLDEKIVAADDADKAGLAALKGTIAVANARLAYAAFQELFSGPRWEKLAAAGARVQRPLWASTGTKNPAYSDTLYVDTLIGPDTVARTVDADYEGAWNKIAALHTAGIDIKAVTDQLEAEGIASFITSFETLLAGVESKRSALAGV